MDPITLFALANGAVAAVKRGCELYNELKAVSGDVKGVLKDLDNQYHSRYRDRKPSSAEKNQYVDERNRVIELSKKQPNDIFNEIGDHLGTYFENMATCMAIFEQEEKHSHEIYTGKSSIGKRALQRVLMETKLVAMQAELREIMVYKCPPELGDLYTRVEKMMEKIKREQSIAIANKVKQDRAAAIKKQVKIDKIKNSIVKWIAVTIGVAYFVVLMWSVIELRKVEYPELGYCIIPKGTWPYEYYTKLKWVQCEPL